MPIDEAGITSASEALLRRLAPGDLDSTLRSITWAAVEVLPEVEYASISMRQRSGALNSFALTDLLLTDLEQQQSRLQEGPCYDVTTDESYVVCGDLAADERYPSYGPVAVRTGIRSQAAIRLFENHGTTGGLNLYSRQVGALADVNAVSRLFSQQAGVALTYTMHIESLREAVETRTRIGQAVGIVMERYKLPEQQAFAFLTRMSQTRNVKLRTIADQMIEAYAKK